MCDWYNSTLNNVSLYNHDNGYSYAYTARNDGLLIFESAHGHSYHHLDIATGTHYEFRINSANDEMISRENAFNPNNRLITAINV